MFLCVTTESLLKDLLEKEPEKLDSQPCEDGCTCEKFGSKIDLKRDYEQLYNMTFQSQPTEEEHFRYEQEVYIISIFFFGNKNYYFDSIFF
jgi:hypothetical protein